MDASFECSHMISNNQNFPSSRMKKLTSPLKVNRLLIYIGQNKNISNHYKIQPQHEYARTPTSRIL